MCIVNPFQGERHVGLLRALWIPAFAGMTWGARGEGPLCPSDISPTSGGNPSERREGVDGLPGALWIPAFAGMTWGLRGVGPLCPIGHFPHEWGKPYRGASPLGWTRSGWGRLVGRRRWGPRSRVRRGRVGRLVRFPKR